MSNKLFIGNLSWGVDTDQLREMFSAYGVVTDAIVMTDRETGRSRGFGFVTFETEEEAQAAIEAMDGQDLDGRPVVVNVAKPREERPRY
jgi:RNA recognition motif-containing protein